MADKNPFEDIVRQAEEERRASGQRAATPNEFSTMIAEAQKKPENQSGGVMGSIDAFMRHFADKATFGGVDAAKGAIDPTSTIATERSITKRTEDTNPYASLIGQIGGTMVPTTLASKGLGMALPYLAKPTAAAGAIREGIVGGAQPIVDAVARGETPHLSEVLAGSGISGALGAILPAAQKFLPKGKISQFDVTPGDVSAMKAATEVGARYKIPLNMSEAAQAAIPGKSGQIEAAYNTATALPKGSVMRTDFERARLPAIETLTKQLDAGTLPFLQRTPGVGARQASKEAETIEKVLPKAVKPPIEDIPGGGIPDLVKNWVKNIPSGGLTKKLQDPQSLDLIGKRTPGMELAQGAATAAGDEQTIVDSWLQSILNEKERRDSQKRAR